MKRILVVDDKVENSYLAEKMLQSAGYQTITATNGVDALALALKDAPDLILSDILMPVMDGFTLCREWRNNEKLKSIPFVFCTATYTDPRDEEFARNLGADGFIIKPEGMKDLLSVVAEKLSVKRPAEDHTGRARPQEEKVFLKEYNEALVRKLEDKMAQLESAEKELKEKNAALEKDIRELKEAEEALLRLNNAVQASGEVIFMTDCEGVFTFVNPAFTGLYGYTAGEVIGKCTPRILKSGKQPVDTYKMFWDSLIHKRQYLGEWINRTKDSRYRIIEMSASSILDPDRNNIGFLAIQRDVTEERAKDEQIRQIQKMESIGTLASGIAHDFNNILSIIIGHTALLAEARNEPAKFAEGLAAIMNATKRGAAVVRQMLTFARKGDVEFKPVAINDSVAEITRLLNETFPKTIKIECRLEKDIPKVMGDATQIHQVLLNLCVNARDAMAGAGVLTIVSARHQGNALRKRFLKAVHEDYVAVQVGDTGTGMDEETKKRIFEPFFTTKGIGKGTGLGLSVVFGIVESHDGFVNVDSQVGRGTTFTMYFPVKSLRTDGAAAETASLAEVKGGTETILFVEDEETLRDLVQINLSVKGYSVLQAGNGPEAIEVYQKHKDEIALVVCDFGLPGFSGRDALKRMKALNPAVNFVLASGYLDPEEKSEIFKEGAREFIQKPYAPNDLLLKVRRALDTA